MNGDTYSFPQGWETPYYIIDEKRLRENLRLISRVSREAGVESILSFKAFALWKTFPIFHEYIRSAAASSPYEARLAKEEFGGLAHTYSPAYEEDTFAAVMECSEKITFNSLSQLHRFLPLVQAWNTASHGHRISAGLRINPGHSEISVPLYDPCAPGSRFGITVAGMPATLPDGVEGFHFHCHCENDSYALCRTLQRIERDFGRWLPSLKWLNIGGGHLMTRKGYDTGHLVATLRQFKAQYPNLEIIMEPGSAFAWQTGELVATVIDVTEDNGIKTAILNTSFTCHMPDCLEMPYRPSVLGAETLERLPSIGEEGAAASCRLGGNSCLSGDYIGYWRFSRLPAPGDKVVFLDMLHYTTVKTSMFNGIAHPAILFRREDGSVEELRRFTYDDYRSRMD